MADLPINGNKVVFENRITLGNALTLLGGLAWAGIFLWYIATAFASQNSKIDFLNDQITDIRCTLVAAGIAPSTRPCVIPAMKFTDHH